MGKEVTVFTSDRRRHVFASEDHVVAEAVTFDQALAREIARLQELDEDDERNGRAGATPRHCTPEAIAAWTRKNRLGARCWMVTKFGGR